ncbi:hypothetical protein BJY04DRAFT_223144 [Aspergillus karnatakaensis]|uniref:uncharacterized protein n=1 Tax=Aspergillus karnatakaensis TaxID=1810916 RepID=UPI003CCD867C
MYHHNPPIARQAALIAQILDFAQVPNILLGWLALGLVQHNMGIPEIEFVIPDEYAEVAIHAIEISPVPLCVKTDCHELQVQRRDETLGSATSRLDAYHAVGFAHFHLNPFTASGLKGAELITLYRQSEILPWVPRLTRSDNVGTIDSPNLTVSTDLNLPAAVDRGPSGPWVGLYPVRILTPCAFIESVMRLLGRDTLVNSELVHTWHIFMELIRYPTSVEKRFTDPAVEVAWVWYICRDNVGGDGLTKIMELGKGFDESGRY